MRSVATDFDRLRPNSSAAIVGERMSASTRNLDAPLPEKPFSLLSQDPAQLAAKQLNRRKSLGYGNQALRASSIEQGLRALTKQVIERFREVIGCDRATLLYNDANSEELVFFLDEQCIRCVEPPLCFDVLYLRVGMGAEAQSQQLVEHTGATKGVLERGVGARGVVVARIHVHASACNADVTGSVGPCVRAGSRT